MELTHHAKEKLKERGIAVEEVEEVLESRLPILWCIPIFS